MKDVRKEGVPFDRLTNLCQEMSTVLDREENRDIRAIIMLHDGERGGIEHYRIKDDNELVSVVLIHLKAIFAAYGKSISILTDNHMVSLDDLE